MSAELAEAVGLWLAEGDNKTQREITFTNSEPRLVVLFHERLTRLLPDITPRIYCYSRGGHVLPPISGIPSKQYTDVRARRPYFLWRAGSTEGRAAWKDIVDDYLHNRDWWPDILRGFFAGEGNIKLSEKSRVVRIAQKRTGWLERILDYFGLKWRFKRRSYIIWSRRSWDILESIRVADLHPDKRARFRQGYVAFQEYHYSRGFLKESVREDLTEPIRTAELAKKYNRSKARVYDVLAELEAEGFAEKFSVGSYFYWIAKGEHTIIISEVKARYLELLTGPMTTTSMAQFFMVDWKSSYRRLSELAVLGLVRRRKDKKWETVPTKRRILVR